MVAVIVLCDDAGVIVIWCMLMMSMRQYIMEKYQGEYPQQKNCFYAFAQLHDRVKIGKCGDVPKILIMVYHKQIIIDHLTIPAM